MVISTERERERERETGGGGGGGGTSKTKTKGAVIEVQEERSNTPGEVRDVQEVTTSKNNTCPSEFSPFTFSSFLKPPSHQTMAEGHSHVANTSTRFTHPCGTSCRPDKAD